MLSGTPSNCGLVSGNSPPTDSVRHLGDPIGAVRHGHGLETPADGTRVELLRLLDIAGHQLVPVEMCRATD